MALYTTYYYSHPVYTIPANSQSVICCEYCGCYHTGVCPKIKAIEYHPDGAIKRVEFHEPQLQTTITFSGLQGE